jgi:hypothetical protein
MGFKFSHLNWLFICVNTVNKLELHPYNNMNAFLSKKFGSVN